MTNVIDFAVERAYLKSGIRDRSLIKDMLEQGYDPCSPKDIIKYNEWNQFRDIVTTSTIDLPSEYKFSDEAIDRLWNDIQNFDTNHTVTVSYDSFDDNSDFIYEPDFSKFFDDNK
jgi:hypothetical protein